MIALELKPIWPTIDQNSSFLGLASCSETVVKTVAWYEAIGFKLPWVGYLVFSQNEPVGSCAFKGAPKNGKVEIAYVTFEECRGRGYGTEMCRLLMNIAANRDPSMLVSARTLTEPGHSTRILEKCGFMNIGEITDHDGTLVWEWVLEKD